MYDIQHIRTDFPILEQKVHEKPLVYLDNAATTQKPRCVVQSIVDEYFSVNANVHRGVHFLSQQATALHEEARDTIRQFINAKSANEIIFTRGTTESINLLASSFTQQFMKPGDEVLLSVMEHHSNIVPWQLQAERQNIKIKVIPMTDDGELMLDKYTQLFTSRTRLVCITHVSNVLGIVNPIKQIIEIAHQHNAAVLVDGAQSVPHLDVDVQELDCDFLAFSGHKMYGPTGIGILYGKEKWLEQMPPYQGGGEMIQRVNFDHTTFNELPYKFEAGTPDYIGSTALAKAVRYMNELGRDNIWQHEQEITNHALKRLSQIPGLHIHGSMRLPRCGVISFQVGQIHHFDLGTLLDRLGIAVRTGHHCAQPLMQRLGVEGTVRASFALYNTQDEIDCLAEGIERVVQMFI